MESSNTFETNVLDMHCFGNCFEIEQEDDRHTYEENPIKVNTGKEKMTQNLHHHLLQRQEKLDLMVEKAEVLTDGSNEYTDLTQQLKQKLLKRKQYWWHFTKE